jgi:UDP-glucuronate decarboxylase
MKIIITGGCGFIGSNLCHKLVDEHQIICIDSLYCGSIANIKLLLNHKNFTFIKKNICDIEKTAFDTVDQIYNLACPASPINYQRDPIGTMKTCFIGTLNMLELAKYNNARLLFTSTSEVYGDPEQHPQTEEYKGNVNCIGPRSCYDEGKRIAETLMYENFGQVDARIVRIFNTYGPKLAKNDGRVVSNFITQALANDDITIYGDGSQTRSLCYIDDMINGLIVSMNSSTYNNPINLGNPEEVTIYELAKIIKELVGSSSKLVFEDLPKDDPTRRCPDIDKAKKLLKWEPIVGLKEGLIKTIDYFKHI